MGDYMDIINQIIIRNYEESDFEQIIDIAKALPKWFTENGINKMQIDLKYQQGFFVLKDSRIIGFLSFYVTEGVGHIGWMGILPDFHRQGIGRKLVEQLISELKQGGIQELQVNTLGDSVDYEPYERTRAFYRGMGFEDFQKIKQDDPECPEQLIMVKHI
jgi:ribosomal protein S18 acetylase RimI-like enzyme